MTTVRERIFEVLRNHKLTTVFGNPGSTELPFLADFPKDFSYILGLHEGTVVGMATGYSLLTDAPAVVNLHTTAGTGNAMGAIVTAWHGQVPLIITAGQQDRRQSRMEPFLWGRQVDFVKPYVKWSNEPNLSVDVPEAIERGYHLASTDPKGPVFISIPMDGLHADCPPVEIRSVSHRVAPDPDAIAEVARIISRSSKIAIIAGEQVDASGATSDLVKLAEKLRAPVFLSPLSYRWSFPSTHELFRGGLPPAMKPLGEALSPYDTVLVVGGAVFMYYPYVPGPAIKEGTRVVQLTNDPGQASRAVTGMSVIGDVSFGIRQLLHQVEPKEGVAPPRNPNRGSVVQPSTPPEAEYVHQQLAEAIPENTVMFTEDPSSERYFRANIVQPKSHFVTASGGLGFAMPAAVGAALAGTSRPVVCILGEGSAQYCIQALWSASTYNAKVTFIVLNNSEYAILKSFGMFLNEKSVPGLDVPNIDFEGLCKGYGIGFKKVVEPTEIIRVVKEAITSQQSSLIEIPIDRTVHPLIGREQ
jgi:benzoylformate decarboxylase